MIFDHFYDDFDIFQRYCDEFFKFFVKIFIRILNDSCDGFSGFL